MNIDAAFFAGAAAFLPRLLKPRVFSTITDAERAQAKAEGEKADRILEKTTVIEVGE